MSCGYIRILGKSRKSVNLRRDRIFLDHRFSRSTGRRSKAKPAANIRTPTRTRNGLVAGSEGSSEGGQLIMKAATTSAMPSTSRTVRLHPSRRRRLVVWDSCEEPERDCDIIGAEARSSQLSGPDVCAIGCSSVDVLPIREATRDAFNHFILSRARFRSSTLTRRSPRNPSCSSSVCCATSCRTTSSSNPRARATRVT